MIFTKEEYLSRLSKVKKIMVQKNMDALIKTIKPTEPKLYISLSLRQVEQMEPGFSIRQQSLKMAV